MNLAETLSCPRCHGSVRNTPDPISGTVRCGDCGTRFDPRQDATAASPAAPEPIGADPAGSDWQPHAGRRLGSYELIAELGRGGMSTVWEARQDSLDRPVAVKILHPHLARDPDLRRRFLREAEALVQVAHPNIVTVLDQGEADGRPYLVTALAGRRTVREELRADRTLPPARVAAIAADVLAGLAHAHGRGLVHRDIKPENLVVADDGRVAVADFGIAQVHHGLHGHTLTQLTGTNVVMGTVAYMAPEQSEPSARVDHRCDLYALGVVLYECLTGNRPVGRFEDPADDLDDLPPAQRRAWNAFVLALLERKPERRPADAAAAQALLDGVVDEPVVADAVEADYELDLDAGAARFVDPRPADAPQPRHSRLLRDPRDSWFAGVCGGLGRYTGIGANWWRIGLILLTILASPLFTIIGYVAAVLLVPPCPDAHYRPRPLNRGLPRRPVGWFAGVCSLLAERTTIPAALWRLAFILTLPFFSWAVYLALAILLPATPPRRFVDRARRSGHTTRTATAVAASDSEADTAAEPRHIDARNRRYWAWATAGLLLAWAFPAGQLAEQAVGVDALTNFFLFALIVAVAALLHSRVRPKERPASGAIGGLIAALGCLALFAVSAGFLSGETRYAGAVLGLAGWSILLLVLVGVLRARYAVISQSLGLALALLLCVGIAETAQADMAAQGIGVSTHIDWFSLLLGAPMLLVDFLAGDDLSRTTPVQLLGLGLLGWWLASLTLQSVGLLFRSRAAEDGEPAKRFHPAGLLFGLATVSSLLILLLAADLAPAAGLALLTGAGPFATPAIDGWRILALVTAPVFLYLGSRGELVRVVVNGEVRLSDDPRQPRVHGPAMVAIGLGTVVLGCVLLAGLWLGSGREASIHVSNSIDAGRTMPAETAEAAAPPVGLSTPSSVLAVRAPDGTAWEIPFGTTRQHLGDHGAISIAYRADLHHGERLIRAVTFPDRSQVERFPAEGVLPPGARDPVVIGSSTGWTLVEVANAPSSKPESGAVIDAAAERLEPAMPSGR